MSDLKEQAVVMLAEFRRLCSDWHTLFDADYESGVSDDDNSASSLAYIKVEAEVARLYEIPIPNRPWGWLIDENSGLSCGAETWGAIAHAISLHGWEHPVIPCTREEGYAAMNWELTPEPSDEEMEVWRRIWQATSRIGNRYTTEMEVMGMPVQTTIAGEDYFKELVANMREIEAEVTQGDDETRFFGRTG